MKIVIVGPARSGKTELAKRLLSASDERNSAVVYDEVIPSEVGDNWIICVQSAERVPEKLRSAADLVYSCTSSSTPFYWAVRAGFR